ncbi:MAG: type II toxin-antitoxin system PemK/MazF family toxin [Saprospiraceae bacterium]|nr:type II toxin-antitoxin system PemK/MazF family toxin [Saprospiraceae bacterium]MBK9565665.1 type II toxin-antitoxin system PemK/MazF family toxin [Saprospiraceae bacterium]MBP6448509.1 type II toxin-antitoxin system PemK/MazF family toxin [Saprospiraceae bacterium]
MLHKSEILVFQIRSISKVRLVTCLGNITNKEMGKIENNLNKILKY